MLCIHTHRLLPSLTISYHYIMHIYQITVSMAWLLWQKFWQETHHHRHRDLGACRRWISRPKGIQSSGKPVEVGRCWNDVVSWHILVELSHLNSLHVDNASFFLQLPSLFSLLLWMISPWCWHGKHTWRVGNQETSSICLGRITLLLYNILGTGLFEARSLSTWWHLGRTLETGLTSFQKNLYRQKSSSFVLLCIYKRRVYICPIYIAWVLECNTIHICMIGTTYCLCSFEDNNIRTVLFPFNRHVPWLRR